jgi:hypothetical protein
LGVDEQAPISKTPQARDQARTTDNLASGIEGNFLEKHFFYYIGTPFFDRG